MIIYTLKKQIGKPILRYSPFSLHILSYIYMSYFLCPWCTMLLRERLRKGNLSFTVIKEALVFGRGKLWEIYCNYVAASATEVSLQQLIFIAVVIFSCCSFFLGKGTDIPQPRSRNASQQSPPFCISSHISHGDCTGDELERRIIALGYCDLAVIEGRVEQTAASLQEPLRSVFANRASSRKTATAKHFRGATHGGRYQDQLSAKPA